MSPPRRDQPPRRVGTPPAKRAGQPVRGARKAAGAGDEPGRRTGGKPPPRSTGRTGGAGRAGGAGAAGRAGSARKDPGERSKPPRAGAKQPTRRGGRGDDRGAGRAGARDAAKQPPRAWGALARRGAHRLGEDPETASAAWRKAVREARDRATAPAPWEPEQWIEEPAAERSRPRPDRAAAGETPPARPRRPRRMPAPVSEELTTQVGARRAPRLEDRLLAAARAFERDRFPEARRILGPLAKEAPGAAAVRELHGLTLYRLGRWAEAARELEAFRGLTGAVDQHPVLADCYRALGRHRKVEALWSELRQASPGPELLNEGRIVAAGALADRGDVRAAIDLLERGPVTPKRPKWHHLRLWYALADLYERAGDIPRARALFTRLVREDAEFADAVERLGSLG